MPPNNTLKQLGFNEKEVTVYLALLAHGKLTPATLAKLTKINRATVYNVAKSLQGKGVVSDDLSGKTLYFTALPAESLREVVERPMRELEEKRAVVEQAVKELNVVSAQVEYPVPSIHFVEEYELQDFLFGNIAKWQTSVRSVDSAWWGVQDNTVLDVCAPFIHWYWTKPIRKGVSMNFVGNDSPEERNILARHLMPEREVRFSKDMLFTSSIWVGGDYLVMIVTRQHPFYAVEIHDKTLAHNMREVFKKLWSETGGRL